MTALESRDGMYGKHRYGQVRYAEGLFGAVVICGALAVIGDRATIQVVIGDRAFTQVISGETLTFTITIQDRFLDSC